ncbi:hypothetical protein [Aeromicrobium sp. 179-A 4D2 NHS]|uniref:hypothetical protein n=1 Tax=Aeromicrobium sp. 179-A 4D2 NHS TaxID=3142375 RepID=UPI0039A211EE
MTGVTARSWTDEELANLIYDTPHGYTTMLADDELRGHYFDRLRQTAREQVAASDKWKALAAKTGPVCLLRGHDAERVEFEENDVLRRSTSTVTALVCRRCNNTKRLRIVGQMSPPRQY